jgi:hypothetical protein
VQNMDSGYRTWQANACYTVVEKYVLLIRTSTGPSVSNTWSLSESYWSETSWSHNWSNSREKVDCGALSNAI